MVHEKLKQARIAHNLKQSEVAQQIGCASTSFTNWESGKINPPLEQLEKLCVIYGISPLDLLPRRPTLSDIYEIAKLPLAGRTYDETIALTFCGDVTGWTTDDHTPDEYELLALYMKLTKAEKDIILRMLRGL